MINEHISEEQGLAVRLHASPVLRALGVKDLNDLEPHRLTWGDLNEKSKEAIKAARGLTDQLKDNVPEARAAQIQHAFDALMVVRDALETEKDHRNELGSRAPRANGYSPRVPIPSAGSARGVDMPGSGLSEFRDALAGRVEFRDMSIGSGPDGGYFVPTQIDDRILDQLEEIALFAGWPSWSDRRPATTAKSSTGAAQPRAGLRKEATGPRLTSR